MELQYSGRASPSTMEEEEVLEREREAPKAWDERPSSPTIYRESKGGGHRPWEIQSPRRVRPREESLLPKAPRRCLPPLGLFLS